MICVVILTTIGVVRPAPRALAIFLVIPLKPLCHGPSPLARFGTRVILPLKRYPDNSHYQAS
ncbi:hypothetical protein BTHE68_71030 (plasmid) [Burkholderia sp. THE68]|nr:hypothetical protein BTHE68_71030 [Burkholderia sp. THE68]